MLRNECEEKECNVQEEPERKVSLYDHLFCAYLLSHSCGYQQEGSPQEYYEVEHDAKR
jgi:hypothetical protein